MIWLARIANVNTAIPLAKAPPRPLRGITQIAGMLRQTLLSLCVALSPLLTLAPGQTLAQENTPRRITLDEGDPVRIMAPGAASESRTGPAGASQRVEVRTAWGRYCITDHRNNPILADAFATPGSGGTGNFGIPTNCPP